MDALRASVDAVLVGGHTLLAEDPKLTVKSAELRRERIRRGLPENPIKVGVVTEIPPFGVPGTRLDDAGGHRLPLQQFLSTGPAQVFLFTTNCTSPDVIAQLETAWTKVQITGKKRVDLVAMLESLYAAGIRSVLVEGGGTLIAELFRLGLVDVVSAYIASKVFGGASAPTLADGPGFLPEQAPGLALVSVEKFDDEGGVLVHYKVKNQNS